LFTLKMVAECPGRYSLRRKVFRSQASIMTVLGIAFSGAEESIQVPYMQLAAYLTTRLEEGLGGEVESASINHIARGPSDALEPK
jgi:hypothetical protein